MPDRLAGMIARRDGEPVTGFPRCGSFADATPQGGSAVGDVDVLGDRLPVEPRPCLAARREESSNATRRAAGRRGGRGHPTRLLKQNAERLVNALAPAKGCRS